MPKLTNNPLSDPKNWSPETQLVHGGSKRSQFNETSEAIFLNSGYALSTSSGAANSESSATKRSLVATKYFS